MSQLLQTGAQQVQLDTRGFVLNLKNLSRNRSYVKKTLFYLTPTAWNNLHQAGCSKCFWV